MLDQLDKIAWSKRRHAYGEASDVPDLIRELQSPDEETRKVAIHELFGNIWHQGTVYSASASAIPFLFHLLTALGPQDKPSIAMLLANIACGTSSFENSKRSGDRNQILSGIMLEASTGDAIHHAALQGLPLLTPYLTHEDAEVRRSVAEAFGRFPEHAEDLLPLLQEAAQHETEEEARRHMEESIQRLSGAAK